MLNWLAKNHLAKKNLSAKLGLTVKGRSPG